MAIKLQFRILKGGIKQAGYWLIGFRPVDGYSRSGGGRGYSGGR